MSDFWNNTLHEIIAIMYPFTLLISSIQESNEFKKSKTFYGRELKPGREKIVKISHIIQILSAIVFAVVNLYSRQSIYGVWPLLVYLVAKIVAPKQFIKIKKVRLRDRY